MLWKETIELIKSDAYRYSGKCNFTQMVKQYFRIPGFNFTVKMRLTKWAYFSKLKWISFPILYLLHRHAMFKYGISIPFRTDIGKGFYIGHFGGIVIGVDVVIHDNCNISQGVTIGFGGRGDLKGVPTIANNVYIGPHAVVFGKIVIEDNVAIGANCVCNCSCEKNQVVGGVPAKVLNEKGSVDFIHNRWI